MYNTEVAQEAISSDGFEAKVNDDELETMEMWPQVEEVITTKETEQYVVNSSYSGIGLHEVPIIFGNGSAQIRDGPILGPTYAEPVMSTQEIIISNESRLMEVSINIVCE
ncbi:hypothetical protein V6N13_074659 [Hibiscus sabdariffa]